MAERITLTAKDGYIYTDGKKTHGYVIYPSDGVSADDFKQISQEEYDALYNASEDELATDEDYQAALRELGERV